ncbi:MAG: TrkA family potassium uptake protein [Armatimonadetes bacterium]|nr:TrkA family potassium uptake protein [Armatimonadota bacterium]
MRIVIGGCGRVGVRLAHTLARQGHEVHVIDPNASALDRLGPHFSGSRSVGGLLDRRVLLAAGLEHADGLASVSDSDNTNIVLALAARRLFRVPRVVARIYHENRGGAWHTMGVNSLSPILWGVNRMAELLCYSPLEVTTSLGGGHVEVVEAPLPLSLAGRRAADLRVPGQIHVIAFTRGGQTTLAREASELEAGDLLHLAVDGSSMGRLRAMLSPGG